MKVRFNPPSGVSLSYYKGWVGTVVSESEKRVTIRFEDNGFKRGIIILADREHVEVVE